MSKIFIEYQILPQHRSAYSQWIKHVRANNPELEVYEGSDQPGLFVELWSGLSYEAYQELRHARLQQATETEGMNMERKEFDKTDWELLHSWVSGGVSKIHIWFFEKVI